MELSVDKQLYLENIAEKYGLSIAEVSAILHGEPTELPVDERFPIILETVKDADEMFFCLLWKGEATPAPIAHSNFHGYVARILEGIEARLERTGYNFQVFASNPTIADETFFESLIQKRPEAGFIHITSQDNSILETVCQRYQRPIVYINHPVKADMSDKYLIDIDHRNVAETVLTHLTRLGHQRIAFITGAMEHQTAIDRLNSFKRASRRIGISLKQNYIIESTWREQDGYQAGLQLLEENPAPTAIIASNDRMAIGVIKALKDQGLRVPQDVSVVGYDDIATSVTPALTTVRLPMSRIGRESASYLITLLEGGKPYPQHYTLPLELIIRDSTGPASA